jgi:uncharacterized protein (TIGR00725 family)
MSPACLAARASAGVASLERTAPAPGSAAGPGRRPPRVGVIGSRQASGALCDLAEEVGRRLAEAGAILICGGLGGVMAAASRGAARAGGTVVGILPGDSAADANPDVTLPVVTGLGLARNVIVVRSAQAIIAIGGGHGTLSEMAFALQIGVPVFGLRATYLAGEVPAAATAAEAVAAALAAIRE